MFLLYFRRGVQIENKKKNKKSKEKGFTLTELLVVIVVLALLAGLAIPIIAGQIHLSKKTK